MFRLDRVAWSKKLKNLEELLIHCKNSYILFYSRERRGLEREEYLCIYFKNFKGTLISIWWKDKPSSTARSSFSITKYSGCRRARKFPSRRQNEKRRPRGRGGGGGGGLTRDCRGKFLDEILPFVVTRLLSIRQEKISRLLVVEIIDQLFLIVLEIEKEIVKREYSKKKKKRLTCSTWSMQLLFTFYLLFV